MDATRAAEGDPATFAASIDRLRASLESPRMRLFRQFNGLEAGIKFLADMRADLRRLIAVHPAFRPHHSALPYLLSKWLHPGSPEMWPTTRYPPPALARNRLHQRTPG